MTKPVQPAIEPAEIIASRPLVVLRRAFHGDSWETRFIAGNNGAFGYSPEELSQGAVSWRDIVHPGDLPGLTGKIGASAAGGAREFQLGYRVVCKDGSILPVREYNTAICDPGGNVLCYDTVISPAPLPAAAGCDTMLDLLHCMVLALRPRDGAILFANDAFRQAFGPARAGEPMGKYLDTALTSAVSAPNQGRAHSHREVYSPRTGKWLEAFWDDCTWPDGQPARLVHCYDISAQKLYEQTVASRAYLDHLTSLPNRYRCDLDLQKAIGEARRAGKGGYVLFIDVDDFKIVNDSYGHNYGDGVLVSLADFLQRSFPAPDMVFRFGGDEFLILISHENAHRLEEYLQLLLDRAAKPWKALDKEFYCSLSIGVKDFPGSGEDHKSIIKNADIAMYHAKKSGKNKYAFYENILSVETIERSHMESLLRRSMENGFSGFEVYYQPVQNIGTGRIKGAEALLRMYGDNNEVLLPADFMPLAEYLGFMVPIGEFVLQRAAEQCKRINRAGYPDFTMSVNLSAKQLGQKNIIPLLQAALEESGVNPHNIIIGVNESVLTENAGRMTAICAEMSRAGLRLSLDDFGGGTCSFLHLRDLPVEVIKISTQFIQKAEDPYCRYFIEMAIHMGHLMNRVVCVNGVENEAQMSLCVELGADCLQGFYFHRPNRSDILYELLDKAACSLTDRP